MKKKNYLGIFIKFFFQGILIIGPLSATVWIIWSIFKSVDNLELFRHLYQVFLSRNSYYRSS